jgi:Ca2+/H+ antiporter
LQESSQSSSSNSDDEVINNSVIGSAGTVIWLIGMTVVIAVLSNYVITTIEVYTSTLLSCFRFISASLFCYQEASDALGIPVRFISIILLPVVGNAAEHAGTIIFAFKTKIVRMCPNRILLFKFSELNSPTIIFLVGHHPGNCSWFSYSNFAACGEN